MANLSEKKKTVEEQLARLILKHQYPEQFNGLQHIGKNKSPDLQDHDTSVGIEVTTAISNRECSSLYDKYCEEIILGDKKREVDSKLLKNYCWFYYDEKGRVKYMYSNTMRDISPAQLSELAGEDIINIGYKKIDKLNKGHYERFRTNGLFIFADSRASVSTIWRDMNMIAQYQRELPRAFDRFYILREDKLFAFNEEGICIRNPEVSNIGNLRLQAEEIVGLNS